MGSLPTLRFLTPLHHSPYHFPATMRLPKRDNKDNKEEDQALSLNRGNE